MWTYKPNTQGQGQWVLLLDGHIAATVYRPENIVKKMVDDLNYAKLTDGPEAWDDERWSEIYKSI